MKLFIRHIALLTALCHLSGLLADERNLIESFTISKNRIEVKVNALLKPHYLQSDFFAEYDSDINLETMHPSIPLLAFIFNVISIVWISGQTYYIDYIDKDAYESLKVIKQVLMRMYPATSWAGQLIPRTLVANDAPEHLDYNTMGLLFSGGLDSTCSSMSTVHKKQLLITAWGQWDIPLESEEIWSERKKGIIEFAQTYGHTNSFVKSNYADESFLNWDVLESLSNEVDSWRLDTTEGMGMFGLAAPILYAKKVPVLYISSTYAWDYPYPSAATPLIDSNVRFAQKFRILQHHFEYNRFDKLKILCEVINKNGFPKPKMKVCDDQSAHNCCEDDCNKCVSTALSLYALGENPSEYGFPVTEDELISAAQNYFSVPQLYWTLWHLQPAQQRVCSGIEKNGDLLPLRWFADLHFGSICSMRCIRARKKVNWPQFRDLAPADLIIPETAQTDIAA
jgi:hypothetical protein